ncbi:MAG: hypothetical protein DRR42_21675 [Gammaproteobacteria bacterium]|nr:MAG: hypothetical protein DRR42_21675 [Gammaproteobacteria bacterium]
MGYMVKSIASLPVNDEIDLYVFTINGNFIGGDYELVTKNFEYLAMQFGDSAAIVKGFDEFFSDELSRRYLGKSIDELWDILPALLITDAHPEQISEESLRLLVPLHHVEEKFASFEIFFKELINFTQTKNPQFLEKFQEKGSWVTDVLNIVDLKPNIFGVGVNINAFVDRLRGKSA